MTTMNIDDLFQRYVNDHPEWMHPTITDYDLKSDVGACAEDLIFSGEFREEIYSQMEDTFCRCFNAEEFTFLLKHYKPFG